MKLCQCGDEQDYHQHYSTRSTYCSRCYPVCKRFRRKRKRWFW